MEVTKEVVEFYRKMKLHFAFNFGVRMRPLEELSKKEGFLDNIRVAILLDQSPEELVNDIARHDKLLYNQSKLN